MCLDALTSGRGTLIGGPVDDGGTVDRFNEMLFVIFRKGRPIVDVRPIALLIGKVFVATTANHTIAMAKAGTVSILGGESEIPV